MLTAHARVSGCYRDKLTDRPDCMKMLAGCGSIQPKILQVFGSNADRPPNLWMVNDRRVLTEADVHAAI